MDGLPAWALDNLAHSLRARGRMDEAREVSARSAEVDPAGMESTVWLAWHAGMAGRVDEVAQLLPRIVLADVRLPLRPWVTLLEACLAAERAGDSRVALPGLARVIALDRHGRALLRRMTARLLRHHTPPLQRPWRWLQLRCGWA
jgi:hypothetical protein